MTKKSVENNVVVGFSQRLLKEYRPLPMSLLRCYKQLRLEERDVIRLLRIIAPILACGHVTEEELAEEFLIPPEDVRVILQPYLDQDLLEANPDGPGYTCSGLMTTLYLLWASDRRLPGDPEPLAPPVRTGPSEQEKENIRQLSHLYRRFEQEFGRNLRPSESAKLREWLEDDFRPAELVEEALIRSVLRDKRTFSYINSILEQWAKKGYTTLSQVQELDLKPEPEEKGSKKPRTAKKPEKESKFAKVYENSLRQES